MPIIDAHEGDLQAASTDLVQRPQAPRKESPRFSIWGTLTAAPKGMAAGAADAAGSTADLLGAFGQALATTEPSAGGMFSLPTPKERKENAAATEKMRTEGLDFMSEGGRSFRNASRDYMPDPATAHAAEQAVGELFRVGTKAIAAAAVMGPVAGAVVSGAEEGFTASDKLAQQGVDLETRSAVGAVTAAVQAGSFALPVAGKTWGQTIGLALAGGPTAYVAQQAATRHILAEADYTRLSEQYDPFDPVGLTLSTVLPFGFGAIAMRAARTTHAPAPEVVDAARTALLTENVTVTRPVPAEDFTGAAAHERAYEQAIDQLAAGRRVDVAEVAPAGERIVGELSPRLAEIKAAMDEQDAALGRVVQEAPPLAAVDDAQVTASTPDAAAPAAKSAEPHGIPVEDPALDARATAIEQATPDLMVQLEGMDKPVRAADLMASLRQELEQDLREVPLVQAAAECFLATL
jgi:hypothetical protein